MEVDKAMFKNSRIVVVMTKKRFMQRTLEVRIELSTYKLPDGDIFNLYHAGVDIISKTFGVPPQYLEPTRRR